MQLSAHPAQGHFVEYSSAMDARTDTPIDMHLVTKTGNMPTMRENTGEIAQALVNVNWLPFAAECYGISSNMKDFVVVATTIFLTDIPNSNFAAFPFEEMSAWNHEAGRITYKTWKAKPTHIEHANQDPTQARGVIFDASIKSVPNYVGNLHRLVLLSGWDRSKFPELAERIASGRSGFSMGAWVRDYSCAVCGASMRQGECAHLHPKNGIKIPFVGNKLTYRIAHGVTGFELSSVKNPAFRSAFAQAIG